MTTTINGTDTTAPIASSTGAVAEIPSGDLDALAADLRGELIRPADADYDTARRVWNGMVDRRPSVIVRCAGTADVQRAVRFVTGHDLRFSVRGGGHNVAGAAVCDDGVVIDLSAMRAVWVDPAGRTVRAQGGATIGDVDRETQLFGLAVPQGVVSETGIAGLTLGGGFGWLRRRYGLACDNLVSAEVVLADGRVVTASDTEHPDLLWALRGGGGNFGIVTSFELRAHPVGPEVYLALSIHPAHDGATLRRFRDWTSGAPDRSAPWACCGTPPRCPRSQPAITVSRCSSSSPSTAATRPRASRPWRRCGRWANPSPT